MTPAELVRLVDELEDRAEAPLTLAEVEGHVGRSLSQEIGDAVLLVDYRQSIDASRVTLCRLNRHHPLVRELTSW